MGIEYFVKNRLNSSFGILFSIMFGFVLSEHVKNTVQLIEIEGQNWQIITLAISIFLFLFLSAFETFIDFDFESKNLSSNDIFRKLLTYIVWFAQFFPFYSMTFILAKPEVSEQSKCQVIASSFGFVYLFYGTYQLIEYINSTKRKNKSSALKHVGFYFLLLLAYWSFYFLTINVLKENIYLALAAVIFILTLTYTIYWRKYYYKVLFQEDESE